MKSNNLWTQLFKAAELGNLEKCKLILEKVGNKNQPNKFGITPLHMAAKNGHLEVTKLFLGKVHNKNPACHDGLTPLHWAAENGHALVYKFILDSFRQNHSKEKNPPSKNGTTPFQLAALNGHFHVCKLILEKIPSKNLKCNTAKITLHTAVKMGKLGVCKILLDLADNKNPSNNNGKTPLFNEEEHGYHRISELHHDVAKEKNYHYYEGWTPLHLATSEGHLDICRLILNYVKDKNPSINDGTTPLHIAAEKGRFDMFRLIFEIAENKNPPRKDGLTPLHIVAEQGPRDMFNLLYKTQEYNNSASSLSILESNGHEEIFILIISDMIGNKDKITFDNWTLLDVTAHFGYFDVCELLIKDADKCIEKSPKTDGRIPRVLHEVTKNSLNKILDLSKSVSNLTHKVKKVGICNGIATTDATTEGHITLFIAINASDVIDYKDWANIRKNISTDDSGKLEINYFQNESNSYLAWVPNRVELKLEESIKNAYWYAKSFLKKIEPTNDFFTDNHDINLSQIIDNCFRFCISSSWGCAFATVLISLGLKQPVFQNLAMTGTISTTGKIGPVLGIDKKVAAVVKAGLENVIIPKSNEKDFKALQAEIKESITVHFVETFEDIFKIAFFLKCEKQS